MDLRGLSKQHPLLYSNKAFVAQWEEEGISGEVGKTLVLCQFTFLHFIIVRVTCQRLSCYTPAVFLLPLPSVWRNSGGLANPTLVHP